MPTLLRCQDTGSGRLPAEPQKDEFPVPNDPPIRSQLATLQSQMSSLLGLFSSSDQKVDKLISQFQETSVNLALLSSRLERLSDDFIEVKTQMTEHSTWSATTAAEFQKRVEALEQRDRIRTEDHKARMALWIAVLSGVASVVGILLQKFL